jgi:hypothetical protein
MLVFFRLVYSGLIVYCLVFFCLWTSVLLRRRNPDNSLARGSRLRGVIFAFTRGMLPWRKESALRNPSSYAAGILYHLASFSSLFALAFPGVLRSRSPLLIAVLTVGLLSGLYLLVKRSVKRNLRSMSGWDDYFSNALVDLLQLSVILALLGQVPYVVSYIVGCAVLAYLPWGKLKHCYFFFASRILLGMSYGRRGVMI